MVTTFEKNFMSLISNNDNDNNFEDIKSYIKKGEDIHFDNEYPLYVTTWKNNPKTTALLIKFGAKFHSVRERAFISSVINNQIQVAEVLIKAGADVNAREGDALKICTLTNNLVMMKFLLLNGADYINVLKYYINNNNIEVLKLLSELGADFNKYNILLNVCGISKEDSYFDTVKFLLDNGVKLNIHTTSPISWCIRNNNIRIIQLFLERGDIITHVSIKICAEISNNDSHFDIVKLFYDNGADFKDTYFNSSNIQIIKYVKQENIFNIKFRETDICPISFESLDGQQKLGCIKCLNVFKKEAIEEWHKYNKNCPLCKCGTRFLNC